MKFFIYGLCNHLFGDTSPKRTGTRHKGFQQIPTIAKTAFNLQIYRPEYTFRQNVVVLPVKI